MKVRKAQRSDLKIIEAIFVYARAYMKASGNPNQWKDNRPEMATVIHDIDEGNFYVIEDDGQIVGCFAFIIGEDPTYKDIKNGSWLNEEPYGTIHRIASNGQSTGLFECVLDYCRPLVGNIRIDTHADNKIMQHLLEKCGFKYCGIIVTDDGTDRLAYQYNCLSIL